MRVARGGLLEQPNVLADPVDRVCSDGAGGGGARSADAREAGVAAAQEAVDGRLEVGKGEGQQAGELACEGRRGARGPGEAVGATVAAEQGFVGEGRADDRERDPLAHEAFLRRDRGTYGLAWAAGTSAPFAGTLSKLLPFPFPNLKTPVDGLLRCGDSCFPGIGTPSAAASGAIAANTLHPVGEQIRLLKATAAREPKYSFLDPGPIGSLYEAVVGWTTPSQELRGQADEAE